MCHKSHLRAQHHPCAGASSVPVECQRAATQQWPRLPENREVGKDMGKRHSRAGGEVRRRCTGKRSRPGGQDQLNSALPDPELPFQVLQSNVEALDSTVAQGLLQNQVVPLHTRYLCEGTKVPFIKQPSVADWLCTGYHGSHFGTAAVSVLWAA